MRNPHFDDCRIAWDDSYSGLYKPRAYEAEFDLQWKLALNSADWGRHPGASTDDHYIDDRIYEWTGIHPAGREGFSDASAGSRVLDHPLDPALIRGKRCIDVGCGMGRWTRVMQKLGAAEVLSLDMSASALESVSRFNPKTLSADVTRLTDDHPNLKSAFDFANLWGVAMCTHDPRHTFMQAASTVRQGGTLYLMVYAPRALHDRPLTNIQRQRFHSLQTIEARLRYVDHVWNRRWDRAYPVRCNIENLLANITGQPKGGKVGVLDMLEPFYNWVIPMDVIQGWMRAAGFGRTIWLNEYEPEHLRCAFHVLGIERATQ